MALVTTLLHLKSDFALLSTCFSAGMFRVCARGERRVGVITSATLALQPDLGMFLAPLRLVLRGS